MSDFQGFGRGADVNKKGQQEKIPGGDRPVLSGL